MPRSIQACEPCRGLTSLAVSTPLITFGAFAMLSKPAVYWDSCVFIDWIENTRTERIKVIKPVIEAAEADELLLVTSAWGMAEVVRCTGKNPVTGQDNPLTVDDERKIVEFFKSPFIEVRALDRMIAQRESIR